MHYVQQRLKRQHQQELEGERDSETMYSRPHPRTVTDHGNKRRVEDDGREMARKEACFFVDSK